MTTTTVSSGAITSTASRKYQDVVVSGNASSSFISPMAPGAAAAVRYDVVSALACQVMGPLGTDDMKADGKRRPASSDQSLLLTNGSSTASLTAMPPAAIVTLGLPRSNRTGLFVPGRTLPPAPCTPTNTPSNVTGALPKTLLRRKRMVRPHRSGLIARRKV